MTVKLEVTKREGAVDAVRKAGRVPGVVYGPKQEPITLSVDKLAFEKMLHEAGEATIIELGGLDEKIEVLIHDVAFNAARGGVEHVDFYAIERGKELTTHVPLEFIGEAPVSKTGATVTKAVHELEVTCRPSDLPSHLDVDISSLVDDESQIHVSDLTIPKGVTLSVGPDFIIATVSAARDNEENEESEAVDMAAVEVAGKGKGETEKE